MNATMCTVQLNPMCAKSCDWEDDPAQAGTGYDNAGRGGAASDKPLADNGDAGVVDEGPSVVKMGGGKARQAMGT
jgi:hypothetical protein